MKTTPDKNIAMIHIARQALGMDDDEYRDLLEQLTGQRSVARMTPAQRRRVLEHLKKCGFVVKPKPAKTDQVSKLSALWHELADIGVVRDRRPAALLTWCKRQNPDTPDDLRKLTPIEINPLIEALKQLHARALAVQTIIRARQTAQDSAP